MLYSPDPILLHIGPLAIHWYGLTMALGLLAGLGVTVKVGSWYGVAKETAFDLFFYLVIFGFIGARLFYVLYNLPYFLDNPLDAMKIWEGGIGIHGGIVAGAAIVWQFARRRGQSPWLLAAIITPGLALGQAIGRWGNFFNQELFGLPTNLPWGIPIDAAHRPEAFSAFMYFHPTFLYESVGNILIFTVLLYMHRSLRRGYYQLSANSYQLIVFMYILLYSLLRFAMETLRLDEVGLIGGIRVTMWLAVAGMVVGGLGLTRSKLRIDKQ